MTVRLLSLPSSSVPAELVVSDLLGYDELIENSRVSGRPSKFELAQGGTLFFQDVDALPLEAQAVLINALEIGVVQRLGSQRPIAVEARVIASTLADMEALISQGAFRPDLYYRLSTFTITLPPLRERPRDIPLVAERILTRFTRQLWVKKVVEALVALADAVLHAAGDERVAGLEESTSDVAVSRVRPSPRSSNDERLEGDAVGHALEGEGLHDQLGGAHLVEAAVEAELVAVARRARSGTTPPVRQSKWSMRISWRRGPSHWTNSSGSVWARKTFAGGASNSRMMRTSGTFGVDDDLGLVGAGRGHRRCSCSCGVGGVGVDVVGHGRAGRRRGGGSAPRPGAGSARSTWS